MLHIAAHRGKKYNDFQGKRLGVLVNDFDGEETLVDALTEPTPGVSGFENTDLSQEDFQETPGVGTFGKAFQPTIRSKADLLRPQDSIEEYQDVVDQLKFYDAGEAPKKPERNKKLDKFMRLAQFANILGQGINAASGGFVSGQDIAGGYFDKIAGMDEAYANQLRDYNDKLFRTGIMNTDLNNKAVLQGRQAEADRLLAEDEYQNDLDRDQRKFDQEKEFLQIKIDADIAKAKEESNSKRHYYKSIEDKAQNDKVKGLTTTLRSLLSDRDDIYVPTLEDVEFGRYTETQRNKALKRYQDLDTEIIAYEERLREEQGIEMDDEVRSSTIDENETGRPFTPDEVSRLTSDTVASQTNPQEAKNVLMSIQKDLVSGQLDMMTAIPQIAKMLMREKGLSKEEAKKKAGELVLRALKEG